LALNWAIDFDCSSASSHPDALPPDQPLIGCLPVYPAQMEVPLRFLYIREDNIEKANAAWV
jgi:hypothetical protein